MHNDFATTRRDEWGYEYTGEELLPFAEKQYAEYLRLEMKARKKMSAMIADVKVNQRDPEIEQTKREIESKSKIREQCAVFVHQFSREKQRKFTLSLGDVTFFGIVRDPSENDLKIASEEQ
jgi:hypothetical protein